MAIHKLKNKINTMTHEELQEVYECFWKSATGYSEDDLREHITKYILTFYKMSAYKHSCKEKCYFLIKQIEDL